MKNLALSNPLTSLYLMLTFFWNPSPKEKYVSILERFYADDVFQDETVVTLSVVGITVNDAANPFPYPILSLATPRRLVIHLLCQLMSALNLTHSSRHRSQSSSCSFLQSRYLNIIQRSPESN